jgi:hypothetical protein
MNGYVVLLALKGRLLSGIFNCLNKGKRKLAGFLGMESMLMFLLMER